MTRVQHFYDQVTSTFTYVVSDGETAVAAIIDPVLDLDYASGTLGTRSADEVIEHIRDNNLSLRYILETHIHADHLSSAPYIRERLGGEIVIGSQITTVQETFPRYSLRVMAFAGTVASSILCCPTAIPSRLGASMCLRSMCPATHPLVWLT